MKRTLVFPLLWIACLTLSLTTAQGQERQEQKQAKEANPVVIRLGNEEIRSSEVEALLDDLPPESRNYYRTVGRRQFADYVVTLKVLAAEGERRKLDQQPRTRQTLAIARASILADAARREIESGAPLGAAEIEQYYKDRLRDFEKIHVRLIRIRSASSLGLQPEPSRAAPITTDEAAQRKLEQIRQRILGGEDFAELARQYSDDLETAGQGGDAGWVGHGEQPWLEYAFTLEPGQLGPVSRSPFGFELIRLEELRTPPISDLRSRIERVLRRKKGEEFVQQQREALHPSIDEEFFKPTAPQPTPRSSTSFQIVPAPQGR